jgi:hypothetical protein
LWASHSLEVKPGNPTNRQASHQTAVLGALLVAYLGSVGETRAVRERAEEDRKPSTEVQQRLRVALQGCPPASRSGSSEIAEAWFQGLNPQLHDRSPASMLRTGDLEEAGPAVIAAAPAFLVGG